MADRLLTATEAWVGCLNFDSEGSTSIGSGAPARVCLSAFRWPDWPCCLCCQPKGGFFDPLLLVGVA